jgi:hypothetical protein
MGLFSGAGIDNDNDIRDTDKTAYSGLKDTKLSNSSITNDIQNLVSATISTTILKNSSSIKKIIDLHNTINFAGGSQCLPTICGSSKIIYKNIKQDLVITSDTISNDQNDITLDLVNQTNNDISASMKNLTSDNKNQTNKQKLGSTFGDVVSSATGALDVMSNTVAEVGSGAADCGGIDNKCTAPTLKDTATDLQNQFNLINQF